MHQRMQNIPTRVNTLAGQKKVLVFGSCGQDGSLLCNSLIRKDNSVIGIRRNSTKTAKNHYILGIEKDLQIKKCDLMDFQNLRQIIIKENPNEIYNLAAQSSVGKSFTNPRETIESIANGTLNILEACRKFDLPIVSASSDKAYGEYKSVDLPYTENHDLRPLYPYDVSKASADLIAKSYASELFSMPIVVTRFANIYGPGQTSKQLIPSIINQIKSNSKDIKVGSFKGHQSWLF